MTSQIRVGALCWLLTVEFFVAQFVAQAAWPGYSMAVNDISLLGVISCGAFINPAPGGIEPVCSPLNLVFNAGMAINGALVVLGAWLTRGLWPASRLAGGGLVLLALGGIGTILAGVFPLDVSLPMHTLGAGLALGLACFGFFLVAAAVRRPYPAYAVYSLATGGIALLGFVLYVAEIYLGGRGTIERVAAWPQTLWYMVTGALIVTGYLKPSVSSRR